MPDDKKDIFYEELECKQHRSVLAVNLPLPIIKFLRVRYPHITKIIYVIECFLKEKLAIKLTTF
jgi:hypothetical protein